MSQSGYKTFIPSCLEADSIKTCAVESANGLNTGSVKEHSWNQMQRSGTLTRLPPPDNPNAHSWKSERMPLLTLTKERAEFLGAKTSLDEEDEVLSRFDVITRDNWSCLRIIKVSGLTLILVIVTMMLLVIPVVNHDYSLVYIDTFSSRAIDVDDASMNRGFVAVIDMRGPLSSFSNRTYYYVQAAVTSTRENSEEESIKEHKFGIIPPELAEAVEKDFSEILNKKSFVIENDADWTGNTSVVLSTNYPEVIPLLLEISYTSIATGQGVIYSFVILAVMYIGIGFELAHRTVVSMLAASAAISSMALLNERPPLDDIITWIDIETLTLLFSMMVIVSVLSETGIFNYLGYWTFRTTGGRVWPLLTLLCFITGAISAILDNVTTILLMTPVVVQLCERINVEPVRILIITVIFSNIGGAATPIGDPPNVLIVSNADIVAGGINFTTFTLHMAPCILVCCFVSFFVVKLMNRKLSDIKEDTEIRDVKHEIVIWNKTAQSLSNFSKEEAAVKDIVAMKIEELTQELEDKLQKRQEKRGGGIHEFDFGDFEDDFCITDKKLLMKSLAVLSVTIILFFLSNIPSLNLSLGYTALLGAMGILILQDKADLETILARVEWTTLIFFATLFVATEAFSQLGLLEFIGDVVSSSIKEVGTEFRLAAALMLILWVSGIASALIDNIPFTTMMIPVIIQLANDKELGLPLAPLVYALALGACLGGNGTLIGASANVVCAGVAEQHGYKFTFMDFFKVGFPITIVCLIISSVYLLICHVLFSWN